MNITTKFSPGDRAWVWTWQGKPAVALATIGKVTVSITESKGRDGEEVFGNYMPQSEREEVYMCEETGIGSGTLYTLGEHIFETEAQALAAWEAHCKK